MTVAPPESPRGAPLHPTGPLHDSGGEVEGHNPHHDLEDPQDHHRFLWAKTRIRSKVHVRLLPTRQLCHGPNLLTIRQRHNQADWPLAERQYAQLPPLEGRATHKELISDHDHAWQLLLSYTPGGVALILILTFVFLFIPPILIAPMPTLWPLAHDEYDSPHSSKLATKRGTQNKKWFRGGGGKFVLTSK